jgi:hypothetical protein
MRKPARCVAAAVVCLCGLAGSARAEEIATIQVVLQDHRFIPEEIHVVSGKPVFLEITNHDATPEEFESGVLAMEKVIPGGGHLRIRLHPLAPGRYKFFGDFNAGTANGTIISEAAH